MGWGLGFESAGCWMNRNFYLLFSRFFGGLVVCVMIFQRMKIKTKEGERDDDIAHRDRR